MTRPTAEQHAAYARVGDAVDARDDEALHVAVLELIEALGEGPMIVAYGAGESLVDLWRRSREVWPSDNIDVAFQRRRLIAEALTALDRRFPAADLRFGLDIAMLESQESEHARLEELLDTAPQAAARGAFLAMDLYGITLTDSLGEMLVRSLLIEAARLERTAGVPPSELTEALHFALGHPGWLPEGVTTADLAVIVATLDYLREDLSRIDETLDQAEGGPFASSSSAGYLAVLRAASAIDRFDVGRAEILLRAAAQPVKASGDPSLITIYRGLCDMIARSRQQRVGDIFAEMAAVKTNRTDPSELDDIALILAVHEQLTQHDIGDDLRERLALWRESGSDQSAIDTKAILWALSALIAIADGDIRQANGYARLSREAHAELPKNGMRATYVDSLLLTCDLTIALRSDDAAVASHLDIPSRQRTPSGDTYLDALAGAQQALILLAAQKPREAVAAGIRALGVIRSQLATLRGSSERLGLARVFEPLYETLLRSAWRAADPRLMAEVLEVLRAQDRPIARAAPTSADLPLGQAVPPPFGQRPFLQTTPDLIDVIEAPATSPILMPWGSVVPASAAGDAPTSIVPLVVPR